MVESKKRSLLLAVGDRVLISFVKPHLTLSLLCIGVASLISGFNAMAREYSEAERKAMFVRMPTPTYPYEARRSREEGNGLFRLHVDERGKVTSVTILKSTGHQTLDEEGLRTLKAWSARSGERREVDVPLHFRLSGGVVSKDNGAGKDGLGMMKSRDR